MKRLSLTRLLPRLVLTIGIALLLTPMAYAGGGAVSHHYAPPPLDAGSALPNPDYIAPVNREVSARTSGNGFDWTDAAIGAAGTFGLLLVATSSGFVLRRSRKRGLAV
jgi:hypothetical protein